MSHTKEDDTMSKRIIPTIAAAGLLALAPAFAQSQGTTSGTGTQGTGTQGTGTQGTGTQGTGSGSQGSGSHDTHQGHGHGTTGQGQSGTTGGTTGTGRGTQDPNELKVQDEKFFNQAASGGMLEVELGRLAAEKGASTQVKAFGQRMVTDHGKANQQLMQVAQSMRKAMPTQMLPEHRAHRDQMARLSGAEFDRMYMTHMLKEHRKDIASFEKQAQNGQDPALRSFAQQTLPVLREHRNMAETVASQVGARDEQSASNPQ
jgi:putative membrane protein